MKLRDLFLFYLFHISFQSIDQFTAESSDASQRSFPTLFNNALRKIVGATYRKWLDATILQLKYSSINYFLTDLKKKRRGLLLKYFNQLSRNCYLD